MRNFATNTFQYLTVNERATLARAESRSWGAFVCLALFAALAIVTMSSTVAAQSRYTFSSIANLDDYAGYFEPATINNRGDVLFGPALLTGGEGVLLWHRGTLTTI